MPKPPVCSFAPRGVRPLGRAGAFVAGADDPNAMSYNPAGLAFAVNGALVDFGLPLHYTDFTRQNPVSGEFMPTVRGQGLTLPSPTMAAVYRFESLPEVTFGSSVHADYPLLQNWPDELSDGSPSAPTLCDFELQRYGRGEDCRWRRLDAY